MINEQLLIKNLRLELALQNRHRALLEAQGQALVKCDRGLFMALRDELDDLFARLQTQEEERTELMRGETGELCTLSILLEQVTPRGRRTLEGLKSELGKTLGQIRELSARNQGLINNELKYIAFMLDLFVEAGRSAEVGYSAGGGLGRRLLLDRQA